MDLKTLKTTWKCRNGIASYLETNPESPQKRALQQLLTDLIKELKDRNQDINQLEKNSLELQMDVASVGDGDQAKIETMEFQWSMLLFAMPNIYPAFDNSDFINKTIKVVKMLRNPILRARATSMETIESFCSQGEDIDSAHVTEAEKGAVISSVYGENVKVVFFTDFLDYIISEKL